MSDTSETIFADLAVNITAALGVVKTTLIGSFQGGFTQQVITALVILAVIIIGYKMIIAAYSTQKQLAMTIAKIVFVWVLLMGTSEYALIDEGTQALKSFITSLVPLGGAEEGYAKLDQIMVVGIKKLEQIKEQSSSAFSLLTAGEFAAYVLMGLLWLVGGIAFLMILAVDILLTVFISIGPLFIAFLLFDSTRQFFFSWVQAIFSILIVYLIVLIVFYLFSTVMYNVLNGMVTGIDPPSTAPCRTRRDEEICGFTVPGAIHYDWNKLIGAIVWSVVCCFLLPASAVIGSMLAGGVGAPINSVAGAISGPSRWARNLLGRGASNLTRSALRKSTSNNKNKNNSRKTGELPKSSEVSGRTGNGVSVNYENFKVALAGAGAATTPRFSNFSTDNSGRTSSQTSENDSNQPRTTRSESFNSSNDSSGSNVSNNTVSETDNSNSTSTPTVSSKEAEAPTTVTAKAGDTSLHNVRADSVKADKIHTKEFSTESRGTGSSSLARQRRESSANDNKPTNTERTRHEKAEMAKTATQNKQEHQSRNNARPVATTEQIESRRNDNANMQNTNRTATTKAADNQIMEKNTVQNKQESLVANNSRSITNTEQVGKGQSDKKTSSSRTIDDYKKDNNPVQSGMPETPPVIYADKRTESVITHGDEKKRSLPKKNNDKT